jgi:hypothetical protein
MQPHLIANTLYNTCKFMANYSARAKTLFTFVVRVQITAKPAQSHLAVRHPMVHLMVHLMQN